MKCVLVYIQIDCLWQNGTITMRNDSHREVSTLINYFETCINDLNKDCSLISNNDLIRPDIPSASEDTSNISIVCTDIVPTNVSTNVDDDFNQTIRYRTFSDDIYDRLTCQTLMRTVSSKLSSVKYRTRQTTRKRAHRHHHPPTYINELKAYLAHRQSSTANTVHISDAKRFSHVLVWLSNQTTTLLPIETSMSIDEHRQCSSTSITTDSFLPITQTSSPIDSGSFIENERQWFVRMVVDHSTA
jgi:hypothetical protein